MVGGSRELGAALSIKIRRTAFRRFIPPAKNGGEAKESAASLRKAIKGVIDSLR